MCQYILNPDLRIRRDGYRFVLWPSLPLMKEVPNFIRFLNLEEATWLFLFRKGARIEDAKRFFVCMNLEITHGMVKELSSNPDWRFPDLPDIKLLLPTNNWNPLSIENLRLFIGKSPQKTSIWHQTRTLFPLSLVHVLTYHCNANCDYCYAPKGKDSQYIPMEILRERIMEWDREGISDVTLSGGDIFLHPEIKSIISTYLETQMEIVVSSKSGYPDWFLEIAKAEKRIYLQVSLDVLPGTAAMKLYGNAQFPSLALSTIDQLECIGKKYQIHTVVARQNLKEVSDLIKYIISKNPQHISHWVFSDAGRSGQSNHVYRPPKPEYYYQLNDEIETILGNSGIPFRIGFTKSSESQYRDMKDFLKRAFCSGNRTALTILPSGLVTMCEELYEHPDFLLGNLKTQTTREVWEGEKAKRLFFVENPTLRKGICAQCHWQEQCLVDIGKCWKMAIRAFGETRPFMPQPDCPMAPKGKKVCPFY